VDIQLAQPCHVQTIRIHESFIPGALWRVRLWDGQQFVLVHEQVPRCGQHPAQMRVEEVRLAADQQMVTDRVKLELDQRGGPSWYEIDAVQVVGRVVPANQEGDDDLDEKDETGHLALPAALANILGDATTADCTLVVSSSLSSLLSAAVAGNDTDAMEMRRFPIHRGILAARSPVFRAMIQRHEMPLGGQVNLTGDICPALVQWLLEWIYTGRLAGGTKQLSLDCVGLLVVADYFQVDGLATFCIKAFAHLLTVDNAARLLAYYDGPAGTCVPPVLRSTALSFCGRNFASVSLTPAFRDLTQAQLLAVIDSYNSSSSVGDYNGDSDGDGIGDGESDGDSDGDSADDSDDDSDDEGDDDIDAHP
jgi:hypothetical protein